MAASQSGNQRGGGRGTGGTFQRKKTWPPCRQPVNTRRERKPVGINTNREKKWPPKSQTKMGGGGGLSPHSQPTNGGGGQMVITRETRWPPHSQHTGTQERSGV
jgi:hypothetical protein